VDESSSSSGQAERKRGSFTRSFLHVNRGSMRDYQYYSLGLLVFGLSFFLHSPCPFCPRAYSDLYSLFFQVYSSGDRWFSGTVGTIGIPYVDYVFEYPPVVAGMFYSTSVISLLSGLAFAARSATFYTIPALVFLLPTYLLYLKVTKDISKMLNAGLLSLFFAVAGFGMLYYLVYNFDIIAIVLALLSLLQLTKGRTRSAGVLLGLSVASKILTGIIVIPSLIYLARKDIRSAASYFLCFLAAVIVTFGPVYLLAPTGFQAMLKWHANWYCENCFYIMIADDAYSTSWRLVAQALMILVPLVVMATTRDSDGEVLLMRRSLLMIPAVVSFSWVYSPQMNVMIAPAYLLAGGPLAFVMLAASDFLNMLVMVFFFRSDVLCRIFGVHACPIDVQWRESPIQWIAFARIVLLWVFIVAVMISSRHKSPTVHYREEAVINDV